MQKLSEKASNNKVSSLGNRHKRICLQSINGSKYAGQIESLLNPFSLKLYEQAELENVHTMSEDKVHLNVLKLDDALRKMHGRCIEYDRENPGQKVCGFIFPEGAYGPVLRLNVIKKQDAVADILRKLNSLGNANGLSETIAELKAAFDLLLQANNEEIIALNAMKDSDILLEQLKIKVVKQYNDNYHNASIDYGKNYAEMLYPSLKSKTVKEIPVVVKDAEVK